MVITPRAYNVITGRIKLRKMPTSSYKGKVLVISVYDLAYVLDLTEQLDKKDLMYYVECRGLGHLILFYTFGADDKLKSVVQYATRAYNAKYRRGVSTASIEWKKFIGSLDEQWCDHVLTTLSLPDFYEEIIKYNDTEPIPIPACEKVLHARRVPTKSIDSTVGGVYRPIVPYVVVSDGDKDYHSVSMSNNEQRDTVCFCKCK